MSSSVKIFAAALVAAFISPASPASDGEKPLWTAGLMTDTHIGETDESCARAKAEDMLADAASRYPGKPIFVFDHVPARGITFNSTTWSRPHPLPPRQNRET